MALAKTPQSLSQPQIIVSLAPCATSMAARAGAAEELRAKGIEVIELDVTNDASVDAAF